MNRWADEKDRGRRKILHRGLFMEILEYVGFSEDDVLALRKMHEKVEPDFEEVVARFYQAHQSNRHTANVFEGPEQIKRLEKTLGQWLVELFTKDRDFAYCQRRWVIGEVHVGVGLKPKFMFGAMNIVRTELYDIVCKHGFAADWNSVEKALDIDLMIMVQSYWDYVTDVKLRTPLALASGMAHEIRNPLNSLVLNLNLLERGGNFTEVEREICSSLRQEIERIKTTMTEMIDFTRPIDLVCRSFQSSEMEKSLRYQFAEEMGAQHISMEFTHTIGEHEDGSVAIYGDFDRLKQALINLLQNAGHAVVDRTKDVGGEQEEGKIEINFAKTRRGSVINIKDNGPGMKGKDMLRMYELFYTTRAEGTGLGLPIVKQIIDSHEGSIQATSSRAGTEFVIHLPGEDK